jgi:hypothetical protein
MTGADSEPAEHQASSDSTSWQWVDSSDVTRLDVREVQVVSLASTLQAAAVNADHLLVHGDAIFVIDDGARAIRRYDRSGQLVFSVPIGKGAASDLLAPHAMVASDEKLFVMDRNHLNGVTVIDAKGKVAKRIKIQSTSSLSGIASDDSILLVARSGLQSELSEPMGVSLLSRVEASGASYPVRCVADPLYRASIRSHGFYSAFRSVGVASLNGIVYCRQPVSPVVQRFRSAGDSLTPIRVVPPFYRRGRDAAMSLNQRDINAFTSTWTEHLDFFPYGGGFYSVYAHFDTVISARKYRLFGCSIKNRVASSCGMANLADRPLSFLPPDTLATLKVRDGKRPEVVLSVVRTR